MGILRTIMVLTGAAVLMPSPPEAGHASIQQTQISNVIEASYVQVATNTFSDLAAFCDRQPGVCETAGQVAHKPELKAKYSVRLVYEWANEANTASPFAGMPGIATNTDPVITGSTKVATVETSNSQSTLRLDDLIPVWRGPVVSKKS
jgi:hypothetical protein